MKKQDAEYIGILEEAVRCARFINATLTTENTDWLEREFGTAFVMANERLTSAIKRIDECQN